jgi:hypothetical protein
MGITGCGLRAMAPHESQYGVGLTIIAGTMTGPPHSEHVPIRVFMRLVPKQAPDDEGGKQAADGEAK